MANQNAGVVAPLNERVSALRAAMAWVYKKNHFPHNTVGVFIFPVPTWQCWSKSVDQ
jgi:hypothetical protein